ncbi:fungal-specific transcription factor domain-containing protein [Aspergillus pseudonomiae]|uniref:Fungal-specific transcription factor domain-containing protein n=1 Tax=Aspergillus pseudonomiae TaxID=1506151 RepID=A0A5N7DKC9_9EURO|nr:fungal-specific transcription factor domain-containing protein [Aspergillus pseudonomiae]KAE8406890.1 fungal-specific transcription factor domain-containing protein [Aspergillus pseudonomiae]
MQLHLSGGHEALAHKDFLDSATEAIAQTERPDFSDYSSLFYPGNESYSEYEDYMMNQILKDFPSQTEAEVLISTFFCYAEANWYYFDEATFRSQLHALYRSGFATSIADAKLICLAFTVFSMGSQFAHLHQDRPDSDAEGVNIEQTGIPGARFFRHAQHLIPRIITCPSLEGVLSCLLAALYSLPIHNTNTCYTYLGLALRSAICLGLHRRSAGSNLPPQLSEIRNRVFWTTYSIERYGWPTHFPFFPLLFITFFILFVLIIKGVSLSLSGIRKRSNATISIAPSPGDGQI